MLRGVTGLLVGAAGSSDHGNRILNLESVKVRPGVGGTQPSVLAFEPYIMPMPKDLTAWETVEATVDGRLYRASYSVEARTLTCISRAVERRRSSTV